MITLEHIHKIYPVGESEFYALRDVNIHIENADFVAILGPSGSGKSTLLNIIGCLDNPTSGTYRLDSQEITAMKDHEKAKLRNQGIGFVLQDFALLNRETVYYNVMLPLLFCSVPYGKIRKKVMTALEIVGLAGQEKKLANQLSGGQRQRVAIARALVNDPDLILADEPTGQLDSETGKQIMELLGQLNEQGRTVIVVTHDDKVAGYCRRHFRVIDGCVREEIQV